MKTGLIFERQTSTASSKSICSMNLELCELTGTPPDAIFTPNVAKLSVMISDTEWYTMSKVYNSVHPYNNNNKAAILMTLLFQRLEQRMDDYAG